eukprot:CAMPEP_0117523762 /NCGR_PEP_ID=MMETSP0784-20121206/34895_1 /TAXON_ID=39447 /ORGANISM="" /LENGTH=52 /DNA_ID=CAMNT_0005319885 /DNA_START=194 /DNA_END=352 /DNA_ORIENTATION=-
MTFFTDHCQSALHPAWRQAPRPSAKKKKKTAAAAQQHQHMPATRKRALADAV